MPWWEGAYECLARCFRDIRYIALHEPPLRLVTAKSYHPILKNIYIKYRVQASPLNKYFSWKWWPIHYSGFEILTPVVMKRSAYWDITPCSPLKVIRRLRNMVGTCRLHLQGRRIRQARNQHEAGSKQSPAEATCSSETSTDFLRPTWRYITKRQNFFRHTIVWHN
jgi:hypothetical protein